MTYRAGIDVGTNTILLLVAEWDGKALHPLEDHVTVVRLGEGMGKTGAFSHAAMARADEAFARYAQILKKYPGIELRAGATAGAREAQNGSSYLKSVEARFGIPVKLISGEEEAQLSFVGAVGEGRNLRELAVVDIGGGSTEVVGLQGKDLARHSFPMGCVKAHERFFSCDPPLNSEMENLKAHVDALLSAQISLLKNLQGKRWIGVAGTVTYLVSAHLGLTNFEVEKVHGSVLNYEDLLILIEKLKGTRGIERLGWGGMDKGRADVILAGALVLECLMRIAGVREIEASVRGLRFGLAQQDQWP